MEKNQAYIEFNAYGTVSKVTWEYSDIDIYAILMAMRGLLVAHGYHEESIDQAMIDVSNQKDSE